MPASQHLKVLSVRLPEPQFRRFKSLAARRGVSLQEAVHQALEAWAGSPMPQPALEPLQALEGSLGSVDVESLRNQEREAELQRDRQRL